ncbi:unnamed protein product [Arctogadus glacialis]
MSWWTQNQEQQCPLCKRRSSRTEPPRNIALKNLSEAFQRDNVDLCPLHGEKLKLFCRDDLETVCLICRDSEKHAYHRFLPVDEAATIHREEIKKLLKPQKEKLNDFVETKRKCEDIAADINVQTAHTERQIQKGFEKLHQLLKVEEKSRITALREEEQLKGQKIKKEIEELSKQIETISHTVTETEQQLVAGDISFLKKYKASREKVAQPPPSPGLPKGVLLDVDKHLGNLAYSVWKKLEENVSSFPVILDPDTAGPDRHLSGDWPRARRSNTKLPKKILARIQDGPRPRPPSSIQAQPSILDGHRPRLPTSIQDAGLHPGWMEAIHPSWMALMLPKTK